MHIHFTHKTTLVVLILILLSCICYTQTAKRSYIDSTLTALDPDFKTERGVIYVINGVIFDSVQAETELPKYNLKHLVDLTPITCEKVTFIHCNNDIAVIQFAYSQKNKTKRRVLRFVKNMFATSTDNSVLLIDNFPVKQSDSKRALYSLRPRDILYIDTIRKNNIPQVRIWKTDKE